MQGQSVGQVALMSNTGLNMERLFALIDNKKVINIIINIDEDELTNNPNKYIEYTEGWKYPKGIDGGVFFPLSDV